MHRRRRHRLHGLAGAKKRKTQAECEVHVFENGARRKVCAKPKRKVNRANLLKRLKSITCAPKNRSKLKGGLKSWCAANYEAPKKGK